MKLKVLFSIEELMHKFRYYYLGRIEALKGADAKTYKDALKHFEVALRKASQDGATGFKQEVNKWVVLVKLLVGEIPERSLFRVPELRLVLAPYLQLTQGGLEKPGKNQTKKLNTFSFI